MRDIAVVLFFVAAAAMAFRRPFYGALLWVLFGLMNPHRLTYGFAHSLPFAQVAVVVIFFAALLHAKDVRWPKGAPIWWLLLLIVWMTITTTSAIVPEPSWGKYQEVMKVLGMTVVVAALIHTREQIIALLWVVVASIAFFGVKGGIFTIATGGAYRVWGPPSSVVNGNNELAVALITVIPLMYCLAMNAGAAKAFKPVAWIPASFIKGGMLVATLLCAASAIGSQSRGALLAIAAMSVVLWWRSHSKALLASVLVLAVMVALPMMPDTWFERMQTIQTYEEDLSALGRINAWEMAINIANDRVLGAGFATANPVVFGMYSPRQGQEWILVAHSIYFQILGEHGYIGLAIYLLFWISTYRTAGALVRLGRGRADMAWIVSLGNMAKVSLVGFAVGGAFLSLAYWDMPFYIMVIVLAAKRWAQVQIADAPAPEAPGVTRTLAAAAGRHSWP